MEICLAGQWGSVCADNWNTAEASVACRQLGFQAVGELATTLELQVDSAKYIVIKVFDWDTIVIASRFTLVYTNW